MTVEPSAEYVLGGTETELHRLRTQASEYEAQARWLLDTVSVRPGSKVVDVGCGPIGILALLSEKVGTDGQVIGLEREPRFVALARQENGRLGLANVTMVQADALDSGLEKGSFDLVHERLVLVNVPERERLLREMLALTAPGGTMAIEDIDNVSWLCEPSHESWDTLIDAFHKAFRAGGGDPFIGRRLPALMKELGLVEVGSRVQVELPQPGQYRRTHLISLISSVRQKVLQLGLMDESQLDAHINALQQHLADPNTVVIDKLFVQCWGRKPL
jgi:ubiquinone/menaquinone biosynthesis C-methylase UbiE